MSEIDWDKAPEGATHYLPENPARGHMWVKITGAFVYAALGGREFCGWEFWGANPSCIDEFKPVSRPSPAWSGEGLPPVGSTCEYIGGKHGMPEPWPVEIVHHYHGGACMAVAFLYARDGQTRVAGAIDSCFRPIRTPEQIAADERTKACDRMYGVILDSIPEERRKNGSDICEALYDAGYRKVEQPK